MVARRIKMLFCTVLLADIPPARVVSLHHIANTCMLLFSLLLRRKKNS